MFPTLENLLGACLSHECVGSFLALFSCLNFNFLSAWAQFCELKCIEQPPTGGRSSGFTRWVPREPAASAHRGTHNVQEFFNVSFSSTTSFGTADSHLVFIWSLRLVNHRVVADCLCFKMSFYQIWEPEQPRVWSHRSPQRWRRCWVVSSKWADAASESERS